MRLYIYDEETMQVIAIATGNTNEECEAKAAPYTEQDGIAGTYTPAFGFVDGLIENSSAEYI